MQRILLFIKQFFKCNCEDHHSYQLNLAFLAYFRNGGGLK